MKWFNHTLFSVPVFPVLPVSVLVISVLAYPAPEAVAQTAPSAAELAEINNAIALVQQRIQETSSERSEVQTDLFNTEQVIAGIVRRINGINADIAREEQSLRTLQSRSRELQASKSQQQEVIAQYMRSAYQTGREEYLKLLLNQKDIIQASRSLRYYQYFSQARTEKIATYNATLLEIDGLEIEFQQATERLQLSLANLGVQESEQEARLRIRQNSLDELDIVLLQSDSELAMLQQERDEMELLIEQLTSSLSNLSLGSQQLAFAELKGQLPWPNEGPHLNSFGAKYELGDLNWQGVTIAADEGDDVKAIHHGRVIFADWFANSGLLLIIDHGDGYMSLYAHNQLLFKEVGDWVSSGELIAAVGNTGGQRQSGVYFEVRHNGRSEDPLSWCRKL